ncbi:molecular chaperone DnaK [Actinomadura rubrobrunea]|uniref:Molecular chaperone DnaK n=1 Tax=Actinomadura rubrobrunea TaxID=115335 RepID=A0A9W6UYN5_9ACTN|nr:TraR/DksA C4-type zinc finger protein [Actinomadura rubrobrunea]GLW66437.1 molecular chaperone DnaK [Actinomadura rubrobrunea]
MTVSGAARGAASGYEPGGAAARMARERLEHERRTRTAQLVIAEYEAGNRADEAAVARGDRLRRSLEDIEAALARLDAGTYGICQDCGTKIPADRLEILPFARCCVPCQERHQRTEC